MKVGYAPYLRPRADLPRLAVPFWWMAYVITGMVGFEIGDRLGRWATRE